VKTVIARVLLVLVVALAGAAVGQAPAQAACSGTGCTGLDPQAQGCTGTSDVAGTNHPDLGSRITLYVRHSSTCNSRWTRIVMDSNPCCFTWQIAVESQRLLNSNWIASDFQSASIPSNTTGTFWTPMIPNRSDDRVRSCYRITSGSAWTCSGWAA
jgi:hypothetical protein